MTTHESIHPRDLSLFFGSGEDDAPAPRPRSIRAAAQPPPNSGPAAVSEFGNPANPVDGLADGPSDAELVESARQGNRADFGRLVDRYQKRAAWVAFRLLGNREDALEVCQEAFIRAWSRLPDLKEPEKFGAWLLRTVTNQSLNYRRDHKGDSANVPLDDALTAEAAIPGRPVPDGPSANMSADELGRAAKAAIDQLPYKQRMALILFGLEGMPQQKVAETLHTSVEAVKWHVFQARKKLRDMLKDFF